MNLEIKKKIVRKGQSKVFREWNRLSGITEDEFVKGLEWLEENPVNELGLTKVGLVRLRRVRLPLCDSIVFYDEDKNLWVGAEFEVDTGNPQWGTVSTLQKIQLGPNDPV